MITKIQTSEKSNGNKGGSTALVNYLEKYDLEQENEALKKGDLPEPRKGFFTHTDDRLMKSEIIDKIDNNKKGLGKNDSKFYAITIAPSTKEQQQILKSITSKPINSIDDLSKKELNEYENHLKEYSRNCMNEYANHFNRNGLENGNQLLYAGKIEHYREYKGTDKEVKNGEVKSGKKKKGLQTHIHLIVSRKDKDMKFKLSPLALEKGKNNKSVLNGKRVQRGFDRNLFNIKTEKLFDKQFQYNRDVTEKTEYRIQASKDRFKELKIDLSTKLEEKKQLQKELINDYDKRNRYTPIDKEICLENEKSIEINKTKEEEFEL